MYAAETDRHWLSPNQANITHLGAVQYHLSINTHQGAGVRPYRQVRSDVFPFRLGKIQTTFSQAYSNFPDLIISIIIIFVDVIYLEISKLLRVRHLICRCHGNFSQNAKLNTFQVNLFLIVFTKLPNKSI